VRALEILTRLGLESEASLPVDCLSESARQRVAVARALIRDPELVLADHPTSLQDAFGAEMVCDALADAAVAGAAVIAFGRDHALRTIAERRGWRQLGMIDGTLRPLGTVPLDGKQIDELLVELQSTPIAAGSEDSEDIPNIVPFPLSARTAGVA
jgi:ABC-type phosphate/phosphonate transport system ATPase subunit